MALIEPQRRELARGLYASANFVLAGLVLGPILASPIRPWLSVVGFMIYLLMMAYATWINRR